MMMNETISLKAFLIKECGNKRFSHENLSNTAKMRRINQTMLSTDHGSKCCSFSFLPLPLPAWFNLRKWYWPDILDKNLPNRCSSGWRIFRKFPYSLQQCGLSVASLPQNWHTAGWLFVKIKRCAASSSSLM